MFLSQEKQVELKYLLDGHFNARNEINETLDAIYTVAGLAMDAAGNENVAWDDMRVKDIGKVFSLLVAHTWAVMPKVNIENELEKMFGIDGQGNENKA